MSCPMLFCSSAGAPVTFADCCYFHTLFTQVPGDWVQQFKHHWKALKTFLTLKTEIIGTQPDVKCFETTQNLHVQCMQIFPFHCSDVHLIRTGTFEPPSYSEVLKKCHSKQLWLKTLTEITPQRKLSDVQTLLVQHQFWGTQHCLRTLVKASPWELTKTSPVKVEKTKVAEIQTLKKRQKIRSFSRRDQDQQENQQQKTKFLCMQQITVFCGKKKLKIRQPFVMFGALIASWLNEQPPENHF